MKNKFSRRLILNKETITRLNNNDMNLIRGATLIFYCTDSCSVVAICCNTKTNPLEENRDQDKGQG